MKTRAADVEEPLPQILGEVVSDGGSLDGQYRSRVLQRADGVVDQAPGRPDERLEVSGHSGVEPHPAPGRVTPRLDTGKGAAVRLEPHGEQGDDGSTVQPVRPQSTGEERPLARKVRPFPPLRHPGGLAEHGVVEVWQGMEGGLAFPKRQGAHPREHGTTHGSTRSQRAGHRDGHEPSPPRVGSTRLVDDVRHRLRDRRVAEQRLRAVRLTAGRRRCRDHVHVPADLGACGRRRVAGGVVGEDQVVLRVRVADDAEGDAARDVDAVLLGQLAHGAGRVLLQLVPEAGVDERLQVHNVPHAQLRLG